MSRGVTLPHQLMAHDVTWGLSTENHDADRKGFWKQTGLPPSSDPGQAAMATQTVLHLTTLRFLGFQKAVCQRNRKSTNKSPNCLRNCQVQSTVPGTAVYKGEAVGTR